MYPRAVCTFVALLFLTTQSFAQATHSCEPAGLLPGLSYAPPVYVRVGSESWWVNHHAGALAWGWAPSDATPITYPHARFPDPAVNLQWEIPLDATPSEGEIYVVSRVSDATLVHIRFDPRTGPIGNWRVIPGGENTVGTVAIAAGQVLPDGTMSHAIDYFGMAPDGRVMTNRFWPTVSTFPDFMRGVWRGWSEVPGDGVVRSPPVAVSYRGNLHLIARGIDDGIWENVRYATDSWTGWYELPGYGRTRHPPMAAVTRDGSQLEVAVVGRESLYYGYVYRTVRRQTVYDFGGATSWSGHWVRSEGTLAADRRLGMRELAGGQVEIGIYPGKDIWQSFAYRCPAL